MELQGMTKTLARLSTVALFAAGLSACSTVPDWVDPTTWGGDTPATTADNGMQPPADTTAQPGDTTAAPDNGGQFPNLADMPDKPVAPSTSDDRKQVEGSLVADRNKTNYSADQLRGGTEAAAPPPPDTPPPETIASTDQPTQSPPESDDSGASAPPPAPAPTSTASDDDSNPAVPAAAPTTSVTQTASAVQPTGEPAVPSDARSTYPGVQPAVGGSVSPSDAELGFKASTAPALDSSVAQFVAPAILNRYRQTAQMAQASGIGAGSYMAMAGGPAVPAISSSEPAVPLSPPAGTRRARTGSAMSDVGGPETMGGNVVANFDALQSGPAVPMSAYAGANGQPAAVIFFPNDTTVLSAEAKAQVRAVLAQYRASGGQGFIKVVGHSSSRTANMSVERHIAFNFERSQARANSVARALIAQGIPASKVLVEAVGDTQPIYYESMPQGEQGNRRAEIFFQS